MYNCKICSKNINPLYHFIECIDCPIKYHIKCLHTYKFENTAECLNCKKSNFYTERYNYYEYLFYYIYEKYLKSN
jgi:hypothetical protein